jgi:endonuclease-3
VVARKRPSARSLAAQRRVRRGRIGPILEALEARYGAQVWTGPRLDPISELVLTVLSQNTADVNSHRAFVALSERYPTWDAVLSAPTDELIEVIRPGGLAPTKGPRIQAVLAEIAAERGALDLSFLAEFGAREARDWLAALPGIGPKTAALVVLFSFGKPALPVDTHVYRVAWRLGLLPPKTDVAASHDILEAALDPEDVYRFHVLFIRHGRDVCRAPRPICGLCPLTDLCPYYAQVLRGKAKAAPVPRKPPSGEPRYHDELLHGWPVEGALLESRPLGPK